jgi:hypothetical protein
MVDPKVVEAKQPVPLDFLEFLREITSDNSWHSCGKMTYVNAQERTSAFRIDGRTVSLAINGRPIYVGPLF